MIELKDIEKSYLMGQSSLKVLNKVSVRIDAGEFIAIMGPSGSGKSSLMNILGLMDQPDHGSIIIEGQDVLSLNESEISGLRSRSIGFVFQQFHLLSHATALENVMLPQRYGAKTADPGKAEEVLRKVGLGDRLHHKPFELSGGQQQRVAIARALINEPLMLLADEPTGNLDSKSEEEVMQIFRELHKSGITVVIVTHEESIGRQANRLIRIKNGQIVADERRGNQGNIAPIRSSSRQEHPSLRRRLTDLKDLFLQAARNLKGHKVRTVLSTIGITIGVGSVIAMIGVGDGFKLALDEQMSLFGQNTILIEPGQMPASYAGAEGKEILLTRLSADAVRAALPNIKRVVPVKTGSGLLEVGSMRRDGKILGVGDGFFALHNMTTARGRFFASGSTLQREVVLGQDLAKDLFDKENPVGRTIRINKQDFEIVGVLKSNDNMQLYSEKKSVIIPLDLAIKRVLGTDHVQMIEVEGGSGITAEKLEKSVRSILTTVHRIPPSLGKNAIKVQSTDGLQEQMEKIGLMVRLFLGFVASIALIVGGIGIVNIMLVSVSERTREIGLCMAVGATRSDIFKQFMVESIFICLLGGSLGTLGAVGLSLASNAVIKEFQVPLSWGSVLFACFFSTVVGLISGLFPARKASILNPIEALRSI